MRLKKEISGFVSGTKHRIKFLILSPSIIGSCYLLSNTLLYHLFKWQWNRTAWRLLSVWVCVCADSPGSYHWGRMCHNALKKNDCIPEMLFCVFVHACMHACVFARKCSTEHLMACLITAHWSLEVHLKKENASFFACSPIYLPATAKVIWEVGVNMQAGYLPISVFVSSVNPPKSPSPNHKHLSTLGRLALGSYYGCSWLCCLC